MWAHRKFNAETLAGRRVLIVGAGNIGKATAAKLAPFGAHVTLVGRTAREGVHATSELADLLPGRQVVVVVTPLPEVTKGLVNRDFLARMDSGALLVNAGRGQVVDTNALLFELQHRRLIAALDVTDPEPVPAEHPLWRQLGVTISPHPARTVPGTNDLCYSVAAARIKAFALSHLSRRSPDAL
ncbi:NAD(P)-dependent oxidoreductase [Actinokineospora diospyrosa]|uniref:D-isomer specific 2-hydroxyacid dehydrogenase, NAD binding domain n=1 Tax=Actinokineospora diospyrosa TaxID=103728 RepID=A0ABT1I5L9_9PSEU|nr:NAD(P)-dependent oxidoreductase [Actinokineospora diospyrosa]MCP2267914.1 D-isomer specific 2-hydroxyacid dehydrogenase, NAD binding domain [Actinokineospora diospyrosa]